MKFKLDPGTKDLLGVAFVALALLFGMIFLGKVVENIGSPDDYRGGYEGSDILN